jgi:hypothetical protein
MRAAFIRRESLTLSASSLPARIEMLVARVRDHQPPRVSSSRWMQT